MMPISTDHCGRLIAVKVSIPAPPPYPITVISADFQCGICVSEPSPDLSADVGVFLCMHPGPALKAAACQALPEAVIRSGFPAMAGLRVLRWLVPGACGGDEMH